MYSIVLRDLSLLLLLLFLPFAAPEKERGGAGTRRNPARRLSVCICRVCICEEGMHVLSMDRDPKQNFASFSCSLLSSCPLPRSEKAIVEAPGVNGRARLSIYVRTERRGQDVFGVYQLVCSYFLFAFPSSTFCLLSIAGGKGDLAKGRSNSQAFSLVLSVWGVHSISQFSSLTDF